MTAFLFSLGFVLLAEMGDKTQLVAVAFATRYKFSVVMWGVFVATACNHFLAVLTGNYLTNIINIQYIQIIAAVSFILFGLWTIHGDELKGEDKRFNFSPFLTVAVAFFFAEMGDKTQLTTLALAAKYQSVMPVLVGTTAGMLIADAMGIGIGIILGRKIPERIIKWFAALIFIFFGLYGLYEYIPSEMLTLPAIIGTLTFILVSAIFLGRGDVHKIITNYKNTKRSS